MIYQLYFLAGCLVGICVIILPSLLALEYLIYHDSAEYPESEANETQPAARAYHH